VKVAASAVDVLRRPVAGLVVLIYHRVGRRTSVDVDLPVGLFEDQIGFLVERCHVVTLDEALQLVSTPGPPADSVVAVTFDDGTSDFGEVALPILDRHRVPATLYLATRFIEDGHQFPDDGAPMSWAALRDAVSTGLVGVGSHTHGHALLDRIREEDIDYELDHSIDLICGRLGVPANHFAYPKAVPGSVAAERAVRARFRSAAVAGTRANVFGATDPYRLARSPIQVSDGMRWFAHKVRGGLGLEDSLRRRLDRRRYGAAKT